MEFTNGVESPLFENEDAGNNELKFVEIDQTKDIRKVSMYCCHGDDNDIQRMRLIDENNLNILEIIWHDTNDGSWITKKIPDGKEIIGFYGHVTRSRSQIASLGFISDKC